MQNCVCFTVRFMGAPTAVVSPRNYHNIPQVLLPEKTEVRCGTHCTVKKNQTNCKILDLHHEVCFSSLSLGPELMPTARGGAQPDPGLCRGRPPTAEQLWQRSSRREAHTTIWEVFSHNPRQRQWPQSLRCHFLQTLHHIFLLGEWRGLRHSYQVRTLQFFLSLLLPAFIKKFFTIILKQMIGLLQCSVSKESPGRAVHCHFLLAIFIEPLAADTVFGKTVTFKWFKQQMWAIK